MTEQPLVPNGESTGKSSGSETRNDRDTPPCFYCGGSHCSCERYWALERVRVGDDWNWD